MGIGWRRRHSVRAVGDHNDDGDAAPVRRGRKPQRTHRGRTVEERRAQRRAALRQAGLELFGTEGLAGTSITEVCRRSGVTTRYFYEEYGTLEALLLDVFDWRARVLVDGVLAEAVDEGPGQSVAELRARTEAFLQGLTADERVARVMLLESGSHALAERRRVGRQALADFIVTRGLALADTRSYPEPDLRLMARLYLGAVEGAVLDWVGVAPDERPDLQRIVDTLVDVVRLVLRPQD